MFFEEQGLTEEEVKKRQERYGLNLLPKRPPPGRLFLIIQQLKSPLVYILLLAVLATLAIGHYADAVIISLAVLLNTILGFIQENKASQALYALERLVTNQATVIREGKRVLLETAQIVPGEIVILSQGVKIPADGKLLFANRLYLDEAALTGESLAVGKVKENLVFMGTTVSSGQAVMRVEATGAKTRMGSIAEKIQEKKEETPLQKQLKNFSRQLVVVIGILITIIFILGIFYGFSLAEIFATSVALAVSSIPEGLLVSLTVVLAIGMQKIVKHRGLVKNLSGAETLGGVTVIGLDKTGTLTEGKMEVVDFWGEEKELAKQAILANDLDDPLVVAAFLWAKTILKDSLAQGQKIDSIPFSPKERFFISLNQWSDKSRMIFVNGAPELLLNWTKLSENKKKEILLTIDHLSKQGKRIIGFARKEVVLDKESLEIADAKKGLDWVGLLAFSDPVRLGVKQALEQARLAGIKTTVITGDYAKTSEFVLQELGIGISKEEVMTGNELEKLSVSQLAQKVRSVKLFARTTPEQKLMIVEAMKRNGEIVAMMGDGVNDAPALHKADIGIVVGEATDVAKESADLILLDANFSTILEAIEEGRAMFENIRKIILYLLSDAFAEIIVVIGGLAAGLPLPITAVQILWINLVSDGFPNLALTVDPKRAGLMKEKPKPAGERLVNLWMILLISVVSLAAGLMALASFIFVYKTTGNLTAARSMAFLTLGLNSLVYVFSVRALMVPFWQNHLFENRWLVSAVLAGIGLQTLPFATPFLREFFGLASLNLFYWLMAISLSVLLFFVVELFKLVYKRP